MNQPASTEPTRDEEAGRWAVQIATGTLTPNEQDELAAWRIDPENDRAFRRACDVWRDLGLLRDEPEIIAQRAAAMEATRRLNQKRWSRVLPRTSYAQWLTLAASLVLVVCAALWMFPARTQLYSTDIGERRSVVLADGSRLSLDANTRVTVDLASDRRMLTLQAGRAKFDVAKDARRPFTVTAGDRTVIATGTAFSVERLTDHVHVILYRGAVVVAREPRLSTGALLQLKAHPGPDAVALSPGQQLDAQIDRPHSAKIEPVDLGATQGWEAGQLNFNDERLDEAVERVNRYAVHPIVLSHLDAAVARVSGVFEAGDPETFAEAVAEMNHLDIRRDGNSIVLSQSAAVPAPAT